MCLAVPAEVVEIHDGEMATVDADGARAKVSVQLVDDVSVGDFVLVHAGFAIEKVDQEEAERTMELIRELEALSGHDEIS
jgi:hydrogenase expression/formation protein HypC